MAKVKILINGKVVAIDEARKMYDELYKIFGKEPAIPVTTPYIPPYTPPTWFGPGPIQPNDPFVPYCAAPDIGNTTGILNTHDNCSIDSVNITDFNCG